MSSRGRSGKHQRLSGLTHGAGGRFWKIRGGRVGSRESPRLGDRVPRACRRKIKRNSHVQALFLPIRTSLVWVVKTFGHCGHMFTLVWMTGPQKYVAPLAPGTGWVTSFKFQARSRRLPTENLYPNSLVSILPNGLTLDIRAGENAERSANLPLRQVVLVGLSS